MIGPHQQERGIQDRGDWPMKTWGLSLGGMVGSQGQGRRNGGEQAAVGKLSQG